MGRSIHKLSARSVASISTPGRHADGGNLYLYVQPTGAKSWVLLWKQNGKPREMGLGSARDVTLARARALASDARALIVAGNDPLAEKRAKAIDTSNAEAVVEAVSTFGGFADLLIAQIKGGFRNAKHVGQWKMTLGDSYCEALRRKQINEVTTADILKVLEPIWLTKAETAGRIRGRIERVLDAAKAKGLRDGENPARLRGHLALLLPKRPRLQRGHHAAMPYGAVPKFYKSVTALDSVSANALAFLILTTSRTGEVIGAMWQEIDLVEKVWTVPAERMKAGREHRVPLVDAAMAILRQAAEIAPDGADRAQAFIFPGAKSNRALSVMALPMCMRGLGARETVHGFRSSFRDWAGNETPFAREITEQALAHRTGDSTELAYRRSDALDKRRKLMEAWESFLSIAPSTVG